MFLFISWFAGLSISETKIVTLFAHGAVSKSNTIRKKI